MSTIKIFEDRLKILGHQASSIMNHIKLYEGKLNQLHQDKLKITGAIEECQHYITELSKAAEPKDLSLIPDEQK